MKTCINISFPNNVRFRKKVHSQASDHVWFFLNLFSKRPREKRKRKKRKGKRKKEEKKIPRIFTIFSRLQIVRQSGPKDVWQNQDFPINLRNPRGQWNFKYQINQCDPSDVCTNGGSQRFLNHDLEMETI